MKGKSSASIVIYLCFAAFVVLTFVASWKYFEKRAETDVSDGNFNEFPVVVIRSNDAKIVLIKPDGVYEPKTSDDSFLVPVGKEDLVNDWLHKSQVKDGSEGAPVIRFEPISEGRQLVELEIIGEGLFLSRYEATDKEVKPLSFTLSGPLFVLFPCEATFVIGSAVFAILQLVLWLIKRKPKANFVGED